MRKTLADMAKHIKSIILPEPLEAYGIKPVFEDISNEENIREGVLAFRAFLHQLCDVLIEEGDMYDNYKKIAHPFENRITISLSYPFLNNIKYLLRNIGFYGVLTEDGEALIAGNSIFYEKVSDSKNIECLRFLTDCGICVDGIDLSKRRQRLSEVETIKITYPDNPAMLTGLKAMAIAEIEFDTDGVRDTLDILLRCDYRVLKKVETDVGSILKETIRHLSENVQDFIMRLHQLHIDKGLKCDVIIKDFWIKIMYSHGRKEIWGINTSLNNGFEITVKARNTHEYPDTIKKLPLPVQEIIAKGYGCGKRRGVSAVCDRGCKGLCIPLDDSVLDISDGIEVWLDQELSCLRKK
ncbi:hypothetical protein [Alkaliphilus serpentinus]|uniref:Uncharacterized protein n=1 Tax=Alkaliphilus serpentinus TaxID=1482731 RepID=A0A833HLF0_9FIRM|nr:hypothetical protein [Alkaliphilus serpentinus]KAB3525725.1 hypothetical protein F8153_14750 [Alkaliphilus serpentinus]